jgi:hypothetical protein
MANKKDLKEPEDLTESRMRSIRIMLNFLGAGLPASRSPETRLARLLVIDKRNGRLHFRAHLIWFLELFCTGAQQRGRT